MSSTYTNICSVLDLLSRMVVWGKTFTCKVRAVMIMATAKELVSRMLKLRSILIPIIHATITLNGTWGNAYIIVLDLLYCISTFHQIFRILTSFKRVIKKNVPRTKKSELQSPTRPLEICPAIITIQQKKISGIVLDFGLTGLHLHVLQQ